VWVSGVIVPPVVRCRLLWFIAANDRVRGLGGITHPLPAIDPSFHVYIRRLLRP
jgi:hypothetical protein